MKTTMTCPEGATITVECACPENEANTEDTVVPTQSKKKPGPAPGSTPRHVPHTMVEDWTEAWLNKTHTFLGMGLRDGYAGHTVSFNVYKHVATTSISAMRKLVREVKKLEAELEASEEENAAYGEQNQELAEQLSSCMEEREANEKEIRDLKSKLMAFTDGVVAMQGKIKKLETEADKQNPLYNGGMTY